MEAEQIIDRPGPGSPTAQQTWQIWEEAGFLPPARYRNLIEYLHCLNMGEALPEEFCHGVCCTLNDENGSFVITSTDRLIIFADSCGISWKERSAISIAEDVFFHLVAEYLGYDQGPGL